jgi:hypothetical protein
LLTVFFSSDYWIDTGMIVWPIQNLTRVCCWRLDYLVDPIEFRFMVSQTLWTRICGQVVVY